MTIRWLMATLHLFGLGIGLGAIVVRARALARVRNQSDLSPVFYADNLWGLAALLWLSTGLYRAFGGIEKGTGYYLSHPLFHAKLGLFVVVLLLELWPMIILLKWRRALVKSEPIDLSPTARMSRLSQIEAVIVVVMVFLATAVARGLWA